MAEKERLGCQERLREKVGSIWKRFDAELRSHEQAMRDLSRHAPRANGSILSATRLTTAPQAVPQQ